MINTLPPAVNNNLGLPVPLKPIDLHRTGKSAWEELVHHGYQASPLSSMFFPAGAISLAVAIMAAVGSVWWKEDSEWIIEGWAQWPYSSLPAWVKELDSEKLMTIFVGACLATLLVLGVTVYPYAKATCERYLAYDRSKKAMDKILRRRSAPEDDDKATMLAAVSYMLRGPEWWISGLGLFYNKVDAAVRVVVDAMETSRPLHNVAAPPPGRDLGPQLVQVFISDGSQSDISKLLSGFLEGYGDVKGLFVRQRRSGALPCLADATGLDNSHEKQVKRLELLVLVLAATRTWGCPDVVEATQGLAGRYYAAAAGADRSAIRREIHAVMYSMGSNPRYAHQTERRYCCCSRHDSNNDLLPVNELQNAITGKIDEARRTFLRAFNGCSYFTHDQQALYMWALLNGSNGETAARRADVIAQAALQGVAPAVEQNGRYRIVVGNRDRGHVTAQSIFFASDMHRPMLGDCCAKPIITDRFRHNILWYLYQSDTRADKGAFKFYIARLLDHPNAARRDELDLAFTNFLNSYPKSAIMVFPYLTAEQQRLYFWHPEHFTHATRYEILNHLLPAHGAVDGAQDICRNLLAPLQMTPARRELFAEFANTRRCTSNTAYATLAARLLLQLDYTMVGPPLGELQTLFRHTDIAVATRSTMMLTFLQCLDNANRRIFCQRLWTLPAVPVPGIAPGINVYLHTRDQFSAMLNHNPDLMAWVLRNIVDAAAVPVLVAGVALQLSNVQTLLYNSNVASNKLQQCLANNRLNNYQRQCLLPQRLDAAGVATIIEFLRNGAANNGDIRSLDFMVAFLSSPALGHDAMRGYAVSLLMRFVDVSVDAAAAAAAGVHWQALAQQILGLWQSLTLADAITCFTQGLLNVPDAHSGLNAAHLSSAQRRLLSLHLLASLGRDAASYGCNSVRLSARISRLFAFTEGMGMPAERWESPMELACFVASRDNMKTSDYRAALAAWCEQVVPHIYGEQRLVETLLGPRTQQPGGDCYALLYDMVNIELPLGCATLGQVIKGFYCSSLAPTLAAANDAIEESVTYWCVRLINNPAAAAAAAMLQKRTRFRGQMVTLLRAYRDVIQTAERGDYPANNRIRLQEARAGLVAVLVQLQTFEHSFDDDVRDLYQAVDILFTQVDEGPDDGLAHAGANDVAEIQLCLAGALLNDRDANAQTRTQNRRRGASFVLQMCGDYGNDVNVCQQLYQTMHARLGGVQANFNADPLMRLCRVRYLHAQAADIAPVALPAVTPQGGERRVERLMNNPAARQAVVFFGTLLAENYDGYNAVNPPDAIRASKMQWVLWYFYRALGPVIEGDPRALTKALAQVMRTALGRSESELHNSDVERLLMREVALRAQPNLPGILPATWAGPLTAPNNAHAAEPAELAPNVEPPAAEAQDSPRLAAANLLNSLMCARLQRQSRGGRRRRGDKDRYFANLCAAVAYGALADGRDALFTPGVHTSLGRNRVRIGVVLQSIARREAAELQQGRCRGWCACCQGHADEEAVLEQRGEMIHVVNPLEGEGRGRRNYRRDGGGGGGHLAANQVPLLDERDRRVEHKEGEGEDQEREVDLEAGEGGDQADQDSFDNFRGELQTALTRAAISGNYTPVRNSITHYWADISCRHDLKNDLIVTLEQAIQGEGAAGKRAVVLLAWLQAQDGFPEMPESMLAQTAALRHWSGSENARDDDPVNNNLLNAARRLVSVYYANHQLMQAFHLMQALGRFNKPVQYYEQADQPHSRSGHYDFNHFLRVTAFDRREHANFYSQLVKALPGRGDLELDTEREDEDARAMLAVVACAYSNKNQLGAVCQAIWHRLQSYDEQGQGRWVDAFINEAAIVAEGGVLETKEVDGGGIGIADESNEVDGGDGSNDRFDGQICTSSKMMRDLEADEPELAPVFNEGHFHEHLNVRLSLLASLLDGYVAAANDTAIPALIGFEQKEGEDEEVINSPGDLSAERMVQCFEAVWENNAHLKGDIATTYRFLGGDDQRYEKRWVYNVLSHHLKKLVVSANKEARERGQVRAGIEYERDEGLFVSTLFYAIAALPATAGAADHILQLLDTPGVEPLVLLKEMSAFNGGHVDHAEVMARLMGMMLRRLCLHEGLAEHTDTTDENFHIQYGNLGNIEDGGTAVTRINDGVADLMAQYLDPARDVDTDTCLHFLRSNKTVLAPSQSGYAAIDIDGGEGDLHRAMRGMGWAGSAERIYSLRYLQERGTAYMGYHRDGRVAAVLPHRRRSVMDRVRGSSLWGGLAERGGHRRGEGVKPVPAVEQKKGDAGDPTATAYRF